MWLMYPYNITILKYFHSTMDSFVQPKPYPSSRVATIIKINRKNIKFYKIAVTQHTTACCSMQVVDITLAEQPATRITSLRVVQQKYCGSKYKLITLRIQTKVMPRNKCWPLIRLKCIYNFWCSMLVYTPFALCFVTLYDVFMHFLELTY
jgi:hypothetical protein